MRMIWPILASLLVILAAPVAFCQGNAGSAHFPGPTRESGHLFLQVFTHQDYAAHQENWSVAQGHDGLIYVGNDWGILQFDGVSWRLIPTEKNTTVLALDVDRDGRIFVGLENDFGYLAGDSLGRMTYHSLGDVVAEKDRPVTDVWKVHCTSEGTYFFTIKRIYRWSGGRTKVWPITCASLSTVVRDTLYYGEWQKGIMRLVSDSLQLLPGSERFAAVQNLLVMPGPDPHTLLLGTREEGLLLYRGKAFRQFPSEANAFLKKNQLYSYAELPEGQLALGTIRGGLIIIDRVGRIVQTATMKIGLPNPTVVSAFVDRQGGLWLAHLDGVSRLQVGAPFTRFAPANGLKGSVLAIQRHEQTIYAGTHQGVFRLVKGELGDPLFQEIGNINSFSWAFHSTREGLLAGTDKGVYLIDNNRGQALPGYEYRVYGFRRDRRHLNRIYMALQTGLGIMERRGGRWRYLGRIEGLEQEMTSIAQGNDGSIWLGSNAMGLARVILSSDVIKESAAIPAQVTWFKEAQGLPAGEVNALELPGGLVFTTEAGLFRFDEDQQHLTAFSEIGRLLPAAHRYVGVLSAEAQGDIWLYAVAKHNQAGSESHLVGRIRQLAREAAILEHVPFRQILQAGAIKTIYCDSNSVVWFGGSEGIVRYDARRHTGENQPFPTLIRRVTIGEDSLVYGGARPANFGGSDSGAATPSPPAELLLRYSDNALRFGFAAASYDDFRANSFQYFLENFDHDWSQWSNESRKDYTNLSEGFYRFRVRAKNSTGQIGEEAEFSFRIEPPWHRTLWAYISYVLGGLLLLIALFRFQVLRHQKILEARLEREKQEAQLRESLLRAEAAELHARAAEAEKEIEKEQMRRRISSDLHDEIGSNLSSITMISEILQKSKNLPRKEKQRLQTVYRLAGESSASMRDIVWFVNPKNEGFDKLLVRMRSTAGTLLDSIEYSFEEPQELSGMEIGLNLRRNFFLIYKECLQNVVKHARASRVSIRTGRSDDCITLTIADNGVGFDPAAGHSGQGLNNLVSRSAEMGGRIHIQSAPGKGTQIELSVPLSPKGPTTSR